MTKIVTTRKPHKCKRCGAIIPKGEKAMQDQEPIAHWGKAWRTFYFCLPCGLLEYPVGSEAYGWVVDALEGEDPIAYKKRVFHE